MPNNCGGSYREVGPYNQTLFLGCSITNFNMTIGWGSDVSTLTVNLVQDLSYHSNSTRFNPLTTLATSINALPSTAVSHALAGADSNKHLHRVISAGIIKQNTDKVDPGKARWPSTTTASTIYSTDPDPGFFGLLYDIIGVPAFFQFDTGIFFGGMISSWKATGGQGGSPTYEGELRSYTQLLSGCQLIIDDYIGSISTIITDTIAVPSLTLGDYSGSVKRGNLPNVFNIFGYLETFTGVPSADFGKSGKTSEGVSARQIYRALINLTNGTKNSYSPYGAIVGKNPTKIDGSDVNTTTEFYQVDVDVIKLYECGLCRSKTAIDGLNRSLFKLDISEVPIPPNDLYINLKNITIMDFITTICDGSGYDFYVTLLMDSDYSGVIKIKTVSKRSQPPKDIIKSIVSNLVYQGVKVSNFNYGQEFSQDPPRSMKIGGPQQRLLQVRSVVLATKQTSLIFDPYAGNGAGHFVEYATSFENHIRVPDAGSTRINQIATDGGTAVGQKNNSVDFYTSVTFGSSLQIDKGNYFATESIATQSSIVANNPLLSSTNSYPIYSDLICPYFGNDGNDPDAVANDTTISSEVPRKVFFDRKMGQLQIVFNSNDVTTLFSNPYNSRGKFMVLENELRAAASNFESWFSYCFDGFFSTDISDIMYIHFKNTYPVFASRNNFLKGLSIINWNMVGKSTASANMPVNPYAVKIEHAETYVKFLHADLNKVHAFFKKIHDTHYGKSYMIRTPKMNWYSEGNLKLAFDNYALPGTGKIFTDWEIAKDGAWEEKGNFIDDAIRVGSTLSDLFCSDDGRILPILGYNASAELATKDYWNQMNLASRNNSHSLTDLMLSQTKLASAVLNQNDYFYFPLEHDIPADKYAYVPYRSPATLSAGLGNTDSTLMNLQTSHGVPIPTNRIYKMYVSCDDIDEKIIFLDGSPRVIISTPGPIFIGGGKNDTENSLPFVMIHDAVCMKSRGSTKPGIISSFGPRIKESVSLPALLFGWGLNAGLQLMCDNSTLSVNNSSPNTKIGPKATCPAFAGIPVKFNRATYGPWLNQPGLVASEIFSGMSNTDSLVNNICGGVKLDINAELVPWNYGGMDTLDAAIMTQIRDDIKYQQVHENGSIQVAGVVLTSDDGSSYSIGTVLGAAAGFTNGPIVTNMMMTIGEGGITTTYNMRTYLRKIGFFNKENSDRIKANGLEFAKRTREINRSFNRKFNITQIVSPSNNNGDTPKPLRTSPLEAMVGAAYPFVNFNSSITNLATDMAFSPSSFNMPYTPTNIQYNAKDMVRQTTNVGVQDLRELPRELKDDYSRKSIMSLDGLFSPVSFYPTPYGATFNVSLYPRSGCPFCKGTAQYTYTQFNMPNPPTAISFASLINLIGSVTIACVYCEPETEKTKRHYVSVSPRETTPPFVIASGDDLTIISRNNFGALSGISGNPTINYMTLNPILLSTGEFSCFQNRRENDKTVHSIDMVGCGLTVPEKDNSLKLAYSSTPEKNYLSYDQNYIDWCANHGKPRMTSNGQPMVPANNMRFFGLRGPIMVHAWGYDTEGYPVPNSSGEPLLTNGALTVGTTEGSTTTGTIYKNQTYDPIKGTYSKPYKENTFYKGWGQFPNTWPVGPVDLRWDSDARVWTVGANYKPVWVVIETDLVGDQPSRGEIIDGPNDNSPLPSGLRKLVFVRDNLGMNPAPRGAPIYCKYDSKNGFYEPIYNRPFMTSGVITGDSTVDVYNIYKKTDTTYNTVFKNPLGFNVSIGDKGMFNFIGSGWVLQSYKC